MRKTTIIPIILFILALVLAIGSQTFLGACVHEDGSFGPCHWAGRMLMGISAIQAALALLALLLPGERSGLCLAIVPTAIVGLLTPGALIAICAMDTMRCRMVMRPAAMVLCALMLALGLAGWLLSRGKRG